MKQMVLSFLPYKQKRALALVFISFGLIIMAPPLTPLTAWSEIMLDIPIANFIASQTGISFAFSLFLTYTIIPLTLIYLGAVIFPKSTNGILHGILHRIEHGVLRYYHLVKREPFHIIWLLLSILILYWYYTNNLIKV